MLADWRPWAAAPTEAIGVHVDVTVPLYHAPHTLGVAQGVKQVLAGALRGRVVQSGDAVPRSAFAGPLRLVTHAGDAASEEMLTDALITRCAVEYQGDLSGFWGRHCVSKCLCCVDVNCSCFICVYM